MKKKKNSELKRHRLTIKISSHCIVLFSFFFFLEKKKVLWKRSDKIGIDIFTGLLYTDDHRIVSVVTGQSRCFLGREMVSSSCCVTSPQIQELGRRVFISGRGAEGAQGSPVFRI